MVTEKRRQELFKKISQIQQGKGTKPVDEWWDEMIKIIGKGYPKRSKESKSRIAAGIWHKFSPQAKIGIIQRIAGIDGPRGEANPVVCGFCGAINPPVGHTCPQAGTVEEIMQCPTCNTKYYSSESHACYGRRRPMPKRRFEENATMIAESNPRKVTAEDSFQMWLTRNWSMLTDRTPTNMTTEEYARTVYRQSEADRAVRGTWKQSEANPSTPDLLCTFCGGHLGTIQEERGLGCRYRSCMKCGYDWNERHWGWLAAQQHRGPYEENRGVAQDRLIKAYGEGKTRGSEHALSIRGDLLYSYEEPIAKRVGRKAWQVKSRSDYGSVTSNGHCREAIGILRGMGNVIEVAPQTVLTVERMEEGISPYNVDIIAKTEYENNPEYEARQIELVKSFSEGATSGQIGGLSIRGDVLYSYTEPIAKRFRHGTEFPCYIFNVKKQSLHMSPTSARHLGYAKAILSTAAEMVSPDFPGMEDPATVIRYLPEQQIDLIKKFIAGATVGAAGGLSIQGATLYSTTEPIAMREPYGDFWIKPQGDSRISQTHLNMIRAQLHKAEENPLASEAIIEELKRRRARELEMAEQFGTMQKSSMKIETIPGESVPETHRRKRAIMDRRVQMWTEKFQKKYPGATITASFEQGERLAQKRGSRKGNWVFRIEYP